MLSPHVAQQLSERRSRFAEAFRRDPGREVALLLLGLASLFAIFTGALTAKAHRFETNGGGDQGTYWMESAQRYRYVRMVAGGQSIPEIDTRMQAPDGYPPRADTVLQEMVYGRLARALRDPQESLTAWVRRLTRATTASSVLPVALLAFAVTWRRDAALVAALAWALALPVAGRGTGAAIFREDVAVPVLAWHLAFLALWARKGGWWWALPGGLALALALLLWKVVGFYLLMLVTFFATAHAWQREEPRELLAALSALLLPAALASLLPMNLWHEGFLTSTPFLAGVSVAVAMAASMRAPGRPGWTWLLLAAALFAGLRLLLPAAMGLDHAWETIAARVQHLGQKPADPTLLSFHARHYWTGNYESPTLSRLLRDWPPLALAALPGLLLVARWWLPRHWKSLVLDEAPPPPPRKLFDGLGPMESLGGLSSHFVLWFGACFVGSYLVFRKLQLFAALGLVLFVAVSWAGPRLFRRTQRVLVLCALVVAAAQTFGHVPTLDRLLGPLPAGPSWNPVSVFSGESFNELASKLPHLTEHNDVVLASFIVSPFILTYTDRPTVLHCFFEGDVLERYRRITEARFAPEAELWNVAREYGARWYLHEAHHPLRSDVRMSQRYVAGRVDWPHDSAVVRMSFAPEQLEHFELVWENDWFRLFRVLEEDEAARRPGRGVPTPAWSRALFSALWGDPLRAGSGEGEGDPADLLYSTLWGQRSLARGEELLRKGLLAEAERQLQLALEVAPYLWKAEQRLAKLYGERGDDEARRKRELRMRSLQRGLAGEGPLHAVQPKPVELIGVRR